MVTKTLHVTFHKRVHVEEEPFFNSDGKNGIYEEPDKTLFDDVCSAPSLSLARKWLRILHNIHIEPHWVKTKHSYGYMPYYVDIAKMKVEIPFDIVDVTNSDKYVAPSYPQACEVAIKYCLENLVKKEESTSIFSRDIYSCARPKNIESMDCCKICTSRQPNMYCKFLKIETIYIKD